MRRPLSKRTQGAPGERPIPSRHAEVELQNQIMDDLRGLVGGPRSLRFPPRMLCAGLCAMVGRLAALTLRSVPEVLPLLRAEYERAPAVELAQGADRCLGGTPEDVAVFLTIGLSLPGSGKRPSHLVLGAALSLLAQLAKSGGIALGDAGILVQAAHQAVPPSDVEAFQRAAAASRAN